MHLFLFLSITSTNCRSWPQTTTWTTVRRRWMRWTQPCQTWRLLWREGRRPIHWYDTSSHIIIVNALCLQVICTGLVRVFSNPNSFFELEAWHTFGSLFLCCVVSKSPFISGVEQERKPTWTQGRGNNKEIHSERKKSHCYLWGLHLQ